jgi:hypothetical protein
MDAGTPPPRLRERSVGSATERPRRTTRPGTRTLVDDLLRRRQRWRRLSPNAPQRSGTSRWNAAMSTPACEDGVVSSPSRTGSSRGNVDPLAARRPTEARRSRPTTRSCRRQRCAERAATRGRVQPKVAMGARVCRERGYSAQLQPRERDRTAGTLVRRRPRDGPKRVGQNPSQGSWNTLFTARGFVRRLRRPTRRAAHRRTLRKAGASKSLPGPSFADRVGWYIVLGINPSPRTRLFGALFSCDVYAPVWLKSSQRWLWTKKTLGCIISC